MRLPGAALALLLLGEQVHGKIQAIYLKKRADVELVTEQFDRRNAQNDASPSATTGSVPSSIPSIAAAFATTFPMPDPEDTKAACMKTLSTLNGVAASESGMSVCYNVDYFDVKTGQFEAHLLLYQVSAASGNFTSLVPKSMSVSLAYPGAIVATGMSSPKTKRSHAMVFDGDIEPQFSVVKRAVAPILVSDMTFVGQATPQTMSQLANE